MQLITVDEVLATFIACAGEPDETPPGPELADTTFEDLGYDSLALIAAVAELEHQFDVQIPDSELDGLTTFGKLAERVNAIASVT